MGKSDGEPRGSDGQPCPALLKNQASAGKTAGNGEDLRFVQASPGELAAIIQCLKDRAESAPAGARIGRASALARAGLRFVAVVLLAAGVGVGLGDGDLFDDVGPGVAQQPSRPFYGADARQAGEQPGGKAPGSDGGTGRSVPDGPSVGDEDGGAAGQPVCVARAKMCVFRLPDGRCQATGQPCRLCDGCEPHGALENIRTVGRLQYGAGFNDVWFGGEHYDLRGRAKARFCLQYLVAKQAFDENSARHLEKEIDPFVRKKCQLPPLPESAQSNLRIQHFFNDPSRKLTRLRRDLVRAAGRNGRFYLQVV